MAAAAMPDPESAPTSPTEQAPGGLSLQESMISESRQEGEEEGEEGFGEEEAVPETPQASRFVPQCRLEFEITLPTEDEAFGAEIFTDESQHKNLNPAQLEALKKELSDPYSVLRQRIKENMERVIANEARLVVHPPEIPYKEPYNNHNKKLSVQSILGVSKYIKEQPKDLGNAYQIKGPRPDEGIFFGNLYEDTGTKAVSVGSVPLPPAYQPYTHESETAARPHGRAPPTAANPSGAPLHSREVAAQHAEVVRHLDHAGVTPAAKSQADLAASLQQPIDPAATLGSTGAWQHPLEGSGRLFTLKRGGKPVPPE